MPKTKREKQLENAREEKMLKSNHLENAKKEKMLKWNEEEEYSYVADDYVEDEYSDIADDYVADDFEIEIMEDAVNVRDDVARKIMESYPELSVEEKQDVITGCLPTNPYFVDKWIKIKSQIDLEIEGRLGRDPHNRWVSWESYYRYLLDFYSLV